MLSQLLKNIIIEKANGALSESSHYDRSKNEWHVDFQKTHKKIMMLHNDFEEARKSLDDKRARAIQSKIDTLENRSVDMVDAVDKKHGAGTGDAIRDHATMTLEKSEDYNNPLNVKKREIHGIKTDNSLSTIKPMVHQKPLPSAAKRPVGRPKNPPPSLLRQVFRGSALLHMYDAIKREEVDQNSQNNQDITEAKKRDLAHYQPLHPIWAHPNNYRREIGSWEKRPKDHTDDKPESSVTSTKHVIQNLISRLKHKGKNK